MIELADAVVKSVLHAPLNYSDPNTVSYAHIDTVK